MARLVASLGVGELVHFKGVASHEFLLDRLISGDYDVAVLPSVTTPSGDKEGIPVFLMEAMAAGVPVISTPNGGIAELIDAETGVLVPEYDVEALARAIVLLANDGDARIARAGRAREQVRRNFSSEGCVAALRQRISKAVTDSAAGHG
jgi:glycosyltransferase involved in cell wall biosynthesis